MYKPGSSTRDDQTNPKCGEYQRYGGSRDTAIDVDDLMDEYEDVFGLEIVAAGKVDAVMESAVVPRSFGQTSYFLSSPPLSIRWQAVCPSTINSSASTVSPATTISSSSSVSPVNSISSTTFVSPATTITSSTFVSPAASVSSVSAISPTTNKRFVEQEITDFGNSKRFKGVNGTSSMKINYAAGTSGGSQDGKRGLVEIESPRIRERLVMPIEDAAVQDPTKVPYRVYDQDWQAFGELIMPKNNSQVCLSCYEKDKLCHGPPFTCYQCAKTGTECVYPVKAHKQKASAWALHRKIK